MIFKEQEYMGMKGLIYEFLEKNKDKYFSIDEINEKVFSKRLSKKTIYLYLYKLRKQFDKIKQIRRDKMYYYFEEVISNV